MMQTETPALLATSLLAFFRTTFGPTAQMILLAATAAILVTSLLALLRAMLGPTVYDRILAVNMFGTGTILLIAALGYLTKRPAFLDIALIYALMNFIGVICVLKYTTYDSLADGDVDDDADISSEGA